MFDKLDAMPPGPALAEALADVELSGLSGPDRVAVLRASHRQAAHYQALESAAMAAIHDLIGEQDDDPETSFKAAAAEVRVALRLTRSYADSRLADALDFRENLAAVWQSWRDGTIDGRRAEIIAHDTLHLDAPVRCRVAGRALDEAPRLTTGELRARLRELCVATDPADAARRYREAVAGRRVAAGANVDGTANLWGLDLPPDEVAAAMRHVNRVARSLKRRGEHRSMDQLRSDVLVDLLCGRMPGTGALEQVGGGVELRVDLTTLAGLDDKPGEVGGYGPVLADIARLVADRQHDSPWRWVVTHPDTGLPLHVGTTRRRPTAQQAQHARARSPRCVFPGCRVPAAGCDLDHRAAWAETGETCAHCLDLVCPADHTIRHLPGWAYRLLPDGDHIWSTRLGQQVTTSGRPP